MSKPRAKKLDKNVEEFHEKDAEYGVLYPKDDEPKELLQKTYVTEKPRGRSLYAHTCWVTPNRAVELIEYMPDAYNGFKAEDIKMLLEDIDDTFVSLGREGSPVIYFWTQQPEIVSNLIIAYNPSDELSIIEGDSYTWNIPEDTGFELVRAWWD